MGAGEDSHLALGQQFLGVQAGEVVPGQPQQGEVGRAVAQQCRLLADPAEEHLDVDGVGGAGETVEDGGQQSAVAARLQRDGEAAGAVSGPPGRVLRRGQGGEGPASLVEKGRAGAGQEDVTAGAVQQADAEPVFEPLHRAGQRGLGDAEPVGGTAEVPFLGHRDEVGQLARIHTSRVWERGLRGVGRASADWLSRRRQPDGPRRASAAETAAGEGRG